MTYGCLDISKLCPKGAATARRLDGAGVEGVEGVERLEGVEEVDVGVDAEDWRDLEELEWIENELDFNARWLRRALGGTGTDGVPTTDDAALTGANNANANATATETTDDEGAEGGEAQDDTFNTKNSVSINEFAALAEGVATEFLAVLSFNPFAISLSAAVPAIAFVGTLVVVIIIGFAYFLRKDKAERHAMVRVDVPGPPMYTPYLIPPCPPHGQGALHSTD